MTIDKIKLTAAIAALVNLVAGDDAPDIEPKAKRGRPAKAAESEADEDEEESDDEESEDDESEDDEEETNDEEAEDDEDALGPKDDEEEQRTEAKQLVKKVIGKHGVPASKKLLKTYKVDLVSKVPVKSLLAFIKAAKAAAK